MEGTKDKMYCRVSASSTRNSWTPPRPGGPSASFNKDHGHWPKPPKQSLGITKRAIRSAAAKSVKKDGLLPFEIIWAREMFRVGRFEFLNLPRRLPRYRFHASTPAEWMWYSVGLAGLAHPSRLKWPRLEEACNISCSEKWAGPIGHCRKLLKSMTLLNRSKWKHHPKKCWKTMFRLTKHEKCKPQHGVAENKGSTNHPLQNTSDEGWPLKHANPNNDQFPILGKKTGCCSRLSPIHCICHVVSERPVDRRALRPDQNPEGNIACKNR